MILCPSQSCGWSPMCSSACVSYVRRLIILADDPPWFFDCPVVMLPIHLMLMDGSPSIDCLQCLRRIKRRSLGHHVRMYDMLCRVGTHHHDDPSSNPCYPLDVLLLTNFSDLPNLQFTNTNFCALLLLLSIHPVDSLRAHLKSNRYDP